MTSKDRNKKKGRVQGKEFVMRRVFEAPRELVWRAMTDPDLVPRWWGPAKYKTTVEKMDVRPGGRWRLVSRDSEGNQYWLRGEYIEVVPPKRLVQTFEFEGMPGLVSVDSATLEERDGKTTVLLKSVFKTVKDLEAMLASGMEDGAIETWDRFAVLLPEVQGGQNNDQRTASPDLVIVRVFDAPRGAVWKAWTDPAQAMRWWGPKDHTTPFCEIDLRVGGTYLNCMRSPEGKDYWSTGVYREVVPMERIVATDSFADEKGNVVSAAYYGMDSDMPLEMLVTVTFEDVKGKTKMTLRHAGIPAGPDSAGAKQGWSESFDKLAHFLEAGTVATKRPKKAKAAKGELVLMRVFDVPRKRVWRAWTDAKEIKKWWGPKDYTAPHISIDLRVGGKWLYCMRGRGLDGVVRDFWNTGEFLEVVPPEKLVSTVRFSDERGNPVPASEQGVPGDWPDAVRETVTFEDVDGGKKTRITIREVGIPGVMAEMASLGWNMSFDKLARALAR